MLALCLLSAATASVRGTIQSARVSFTVVATARATLPYFAAAPTTELVSWIASADQIPNWLCERASRCPTKGNKNRAIAFRMNTVPRETAMSWSSASRTGPMAAIALPPQIAVPTEIRRDGVRSTESARPRKRPQATAKLIPTSVYRNPERPAWRTSVRLMPKPSPTTEICNSHFEQREVNSGNGFPSASARTSPKARARGGEAEYAEASIPAPNAILLTFFNNQNNRDEVRLPGLRQPPHDTPQNAPVVIQSQRAGLTAIGIGNEHFGSSESLEPADEQTEVLVPGEDDHVA